MPSYVDARVCCYYKAWAFTRWQGSAEAQCVGDRLKPLEIATVDCETKRLKRQEYEILPQCEAEARSLGIQLDIIAFAFTTHNKCLGFLRLLEWKLY